MTPPSCAAHDTDYPVFILGSPRSGTSTLAHVFAEHFGYQGHPEGHLFDLLHRLSATIREHYVIHGITERTRAAEVHGIEHRKRHATTTAEFVGCDELILAVAGAFREQIRAAYGPSWFDKTPGPEAIHCVGLLREIYPEARYVFLIREPISNIESRMRKFPAEPFHKHCEAWVESANAWLRVRADLRPEQYLEVKTHDLDRDPEGVYAALLKLLGGHPLGEAAKSKPPLTKFLTLERTSSTDPAALRSLSDVAWSEEQKQTFLSICSAVMESFGFEAVAGDTASDHLVLPPPYGQKDVEITKGQYGGVWPELRPDGLWIFMHPSSEGTAVTTLTYRDISLQEVTQIRSKLTVTSELAPPVRFTLEIRRNGCDEVVANSAFVCRPLEEREILFALPERVTRSEGGFDLTIRSESAEGRINNAWAMILPLRLEKTPVPAEV